MGKHIIASVYPSMPFAITDEVLNAAREKTNSDAVVVIGYRELQGVAVGTQHVFTDKDSIVNIMGAARQIARGLEQELRERYGNHTVDEILEVVDMQEAYDTDNEGNIKKK